MRPCSPPDSVRRDAHLDLVEPEDGGRHVLHHAAGFDEDAFGLAVPAGEDLGHVDAVERQLETRRDGFDAEALAAARDAHHEQALGDDFRAQVVAHLEELAALQQPLLQPLEAADLAEIRRPPR